MLKFTFTRVFGNDAVSKKSLKFRRFSEGVSTAEGKVSSEMVHLLSEVPMHLHELSHVKLGRLKDLNLADEDVGQGVNANARLLTPQRRQS
eukprot:2626187-Pyramimonas_sp.AAC.3